MKTSTKSKKQTIIELIKSSDLSHDLIALKADSDVAYVKLVEKQLNKQKESAVETTIKRLKIKAESGTFDKVRMPSIASISLMLTQLGVSHNIDDSLNVVEYRSKGRNYVNSRHDGKEGKKLVIKPSKEECEKSGIYYIKLDSSDSYYSWNTHGYARKILKYLTALGKIK